MTGMRGPKSGSGVYTERFHLPLTKDDADRLRLVAAREGVPQSEIVRAALEKYYANEMPEKNG